jgi:hypothetical protein
MNKKEETNTIISKIIKQRKGFLKNITKYKNFKTYNVNYELFLEIPYLKDIEENTSKEFKEKCEIINNDPYFFIDLYLIHMSKNNGNIPINDTINKKDMDIIIEYYEKIHSYLHKFIK